MVRRRRECGEETEGVWRGDGGSVVRRRRECGEETEGVCEETEGVW